jgi:two-component system, sensor histidine kinase and response regulator
MDGFAFAEHIKNAPETTSATVIMLTSSGQSGDATRCRPAGISGYLVKPVHQSDLLDAIYNVLEKKQPQQIAPLVTVHAIRENRTILRVLLAEDNPVNQTLAVRLLERRGYVVFVASAGWKAVEALEKENFDVVLMDVQMPEMNGFEAAAAFVKEKN